MSLITFRSKTECLVIECFDKQLLVSIEDKIYELRELIDHKRVSSSFDLNTLNKEEKEKKKYIPPMNHPWKGDSWKKYINSQKNCKNSTNV